jgi:hypothetical protein
VRLGLGALTEPALGLPVQEHDRVLAAREDDVEVTPVDRLLSPPAIDDAPLLPHERDLLPVHAPRRPVDMRLDERSLRRV